MLEQRVLLSVAPITWGDFTYLGDFLLPEVQGQASTFSCVEPIAAGGAVMAYNPYGNGGKGSLFIRGHVYQQLVSEVSIPSLSPTSQPTATQLQPFGDVAPGFLWDSSQGTSLDTLSGLLVTTPPGQTTPRLLWTVRPYYNTLPYECDSHGVSTLNLAGPQPVGLWNIADYPNNSTAGYLGEIPASFADQYLGGKRILTGQEGVCGDGTSSWGPAAFAIQPWSTTGTFPANGTQLAATPLVYYPPDHAYPGWKHANKVNAVQWVQVGDQQALVFSVTVGMWQDWYGEGTQYPYLTGGDPVDSTKGFHAAPYQSELWFYSIDDVQKVIQGQMQPWEIRPYDRVNIGQYFKGQQRQPGPIAYDAANQRLFLMEANGTTNASGYDPMPLIHVFHVDGSSGSGGSSPAVIRRYVFYNNSAWDGGTPGAEAMDDAAIAPDKRALLPGQTASFANYTSFNQGLNGVMIDIKGLPSASSLGVSDFLFRTGNTDKPGDWGSPSMPLSITIRRGAGTQGSDRVTLVWADGTLRNQWLEVTVKATANTGLTSNDVFYFGNAIGESGNSTADAYVTSADEIGARNNARTLLNPAAADNAFDFNRDRKVDATDQLLVRKNETDAASALRLISAPGKAVGSLDSQLVGAALAAVNPLASPLLRETPSSAVEAEATTDKSSLPSLVLRSKPDDEETRSQWLGWIYEVVRLQSEQRQVRNQGTVIEAVDGYFLAMPQSEEHSPMDFLAAAPRFRQYRPISARP